MSKIKDNFNKSQLGQLVNDIDLSDNRTVQERMLDFKNSQQDQMAVDNRPMKDKIASLEPTMDSAAQLKSNLKDPSFGTGSLLTRPEDTSIQGASDDFMSFLKNDSGNPMDNLLPAKPSIPMEQPISNTSPENAVLNSKANNTVQNKSLGGSNKGASNVNTDPQVTTPQEDILAQLKAARDANAASLAGARQSDKMTDLGNLIMKSGAMAGEGIVNQSGNTKIKLDPAQSVADEAKFAGESAKSKLEALIQDYGLKKGMDDTAYGRKKDEQTRKDKLDENAFDRQYKNRMLDIAENKSKLDKKDTDNAGQKKLDQEFAKEYQDWTSGKRESGISSIEKIKNVVSRMKAGKGTTGGISGIIPIDRITNSDLLANEADVTSEAVKVIKKVLSGSTSDKDVERITKTLWNRDDKNENNIARLERFINDAESDLKTKDDKSKYFQQNKGTLSGYQKDMSMKTTMPTQKSSPSIGQIISSGGKRYKVINNSGDLEEIK